MNNLVEITGMIIKVSPSGEQDRRLTILSAERGKLAVFARGARRPGSAFMGISRVFAFGSFKLYEGRDSYNLQSANISRYFEELAGDIEAACYGTYFLELADYYAREHLREPDILKLLYLSLLALGRANIPNRLVRRVYELRLMLINGEYEDRPPAGTEELAYTWDFICRTPIEKLYTFNLSETLLSLLELAMDRMLEKYVDRRLHSLDILESISS